VIADLETVDKFAGELNSTKVTTRQVDILDNKRLLVSIQNADLVVNCTGPDLTIYLAQLLWMPQSRLARTT
jgi:saccharopine dehydrogenase-like NADP-dependent oxidoreductase